MGIFCRTQKLFSAESVPEKRKTYGSLKMKKSDNEEPELHTHLLKRQRENRSCHKRQLMFFFLSVFFFKLFNQHQH